MLRNQYLFLEISARRRLGRQGELKYLAERELFCSVPYLFSSLLLR